MKVTHILESRAADVEGQVVRAQIDEKVSRLSLVRREVPRGRLIVVEPHVCGVLGLESKPLDVNIYDHSMLAYLEVLQNYGQTRVL